MLNNFTLRCVTKSLRFGILEKVERKALFGPIPTFER